MFTNVASTTITPAGDGVRFHAARTRDEHLAPSDGTRIMCCAMWVGPNRLIAGAFGPEQTNIVYSFAQTLAGYEGANINSVTTNRSEGAAGSFVVLSDVYGDTKRLRALAKDIAATPYLEPRGRRIVPDQVFNLKIIAPDRRQLLRDALGIISIEHGVNIETMVNRTYQNMYDDGFDLLRDSCIGAAGKDDGLLDGMLAGSGVREQGDIGDKGLGGNDGAGTGGGPCAPGTGGIGCGWGGGTDGGGDTGGGGTGGGGTGGTGTGGGTGSTGTGATDYTGRISITQMRLEIPFGVDLRRLQRELQKLGKDWEIRWEERIRGTNFDPKLMRTMFGSMN